MAETNTKHLLLARLRRDTMILAASEDIEELKHFGKHAVHQGRAQEVWIVATEGYFTATDINWQGTDNFTVSTTVPPSSVPALNPHHGEQESLATSDQPATNIREEQAKAAQAQADTGLLVDAGHADVVHEQSATGAGTGGITPTADGKAPPPVSDLAATGIIPPAATDTSNSQPGNPQAGQPVQPAPAPAPTDTSQPSPTATSTPPVEAQPVLATPVSSVPDASSSPAPAPTTSSPAEPVSSTPAPAPAPTPSSAPTQAQIDAAKAVSGPPAASASNPAPAASESTPALASPSQPAATPSAPAAPPPSTSDASAKPADSVLGDLAKPAPDASVPPAASASSTTSSAAPAQSTGPDAASQPSGDASVSAASSGPTTTSTDSAATPGTGGTASS